MIPKYLYSSLGLLALAIWSWLLGWPESITNVCLFMAAFFAVGSLWLRLLYSLNMAGRELAQSLFHRDA